ncbi:methyltransferase family protein [Calditrichota bacterium]
MEKKKLSRKRHDDREDLTGEHAFGDAGQIILFILFFVVWIVDSLIINYSIILSDVISLYIRLPISLIILITSGYLAKAGLNIVFGAVRAKSEVIQSGVFKIVRHPIYLGAILFYLAFLVFSFSISAFIVWIITLLFYQFISKHEEKLLLENFGKDYQEYLDTVPMWIPKLNKKQK